MAVMGITTFLFGAFLLANWPEVSAIFIGWYVALEILTSGIVLIASALVLRQ